MSDVPSPALLDLAAVSGVATEFWDWQGVHRPVGARTLRAVLGALGIDAADDEAAERSRREVHARAERRPLPPVLVLPEGRAHRVPARVATDPPPTAVVELEDGRVRALAVTLSDPPAGGTTATGIDVPSDLPLGWHVLRVDTGDHEHVMPLAVTPERLDLPRGLSEPGQQSWGLMTQLYAMRSRRSWGIGDLADLADAGAWAAGLGADFVLVNPLHAAEPQAPMEPSPYLPTTRRFVNPIYLRVEDVPEVAYLSAAERQLVEWHADDAHRYLEVDFLERDACWAAKEAALRLVFRAPRPLRRQRAFEAFQEAEGQGLVDFATWCAITREHGPVWRDWPEQLRDPRAEEVTAYRQEHAEEVEFWCWLQWVLAEQAAAVHRELRAGGMQLGVMNDLAVGVHPDGADTWMLGDALARGVTVGAPPDQYNQLGQDWSQPPWRPDRLAELAYEPYRAMVRAALRDAGGLRIDHVIGLFRLWWIPEGMSPQEGTYVRFDHEALVGILLLEAQRAGAVVVGEDLGTVEPWVRDYLRERGVLGTSILWFERDADGPVPPERYRELCLATVTTHDLPPTAGYLQGAHLELRERLGLLTREPAVERAADERDREEVLQVLRERGLLRDGAGIEEHVEALHRYLTWSPARLLGVSVSDLAGDVRVINQPGTHEEYPNWRVPLAGPDGRPVLLDDLFDQRWARRLALTVTRQA